MSIYRKSILIFIVILCFYPSLAIADIDQLVEALTSQAAVSGVREGSLGIPSLNKAKAAANASLSTNTTTGSNAGTALDINAGLQNIRLTKDLWLSIIAESAQFNQPSSTTASNPSAIDTITFQSAGIRLSLGSSLDLDSKKQKISACCNNKIAGYTPSSAEIDECNKIGIDITKIENPGGGCTYQEKLDGILKLTSGVSGDFGVRGLFADGDPSVTPGVAVEGILTLNKGRVGGFVSGSGLFINSWNQKAGDSSIQRLGNNEWTVSGGLNYNSNPFNQENGVLRIGLIGRYSQKQWNDNVTRNLKSDHWEASAFVTGNFTENYNATLKLGATKLMDSDHPVFMFTVTPGFGKQIN